MGFVQEQVAKGRGMWMALAVMLVLALPGFFSLPPVDRDEVLFSQASRQMLASGDFVDIRFADGPRYKKPVGIYWLQAASSAVTGVSDQIWAYRLVSLMAALVAVAMTHATARLFLGAGPSFLAGVALAASLMLGVEAHLAKTDAALLASVAICQCFLARAVLGQLTPGQALGFWAALAGSVLIKGPIGPMVVGLTLAGQCLLRRDLGPWRALRPWPGGLLFVALAAPWFVAISYVSHGAFWSASLGRDMFEKLASGQENHGAPPGSYLAAVWLTFFPAALPLAAGLAALWRGRRERVLVFALCWLVPTWVVFELTATKLVHYTLPTYPALALMVGYLWEKRAKLGLWPMALVGLLPLALLAALVWQAGQLGETLPTGFWVAALALVLALGLIGAARGRAASGMAMALAFGGLALNAAIFPSLAAMDTLWPARPLAGFAAAHPGCRFSVAGYAEPSLVFLTDNRVRFVAPEEIAATLAAPGCQLVAQPLGAAPPGAEALGEVRGLDLGTGRKVALTVWLRP